jgi:hypothetical protein
MEPGFSGPVEKLMVQFSESGILFKCPFLISLSIPAQGVAGVVAEKERFYR